MAWPVMLCYGTRPQVIKGSVLRKALTADHQVVAVDTGQHYAGRNRTGNAADIAAEVRRFLATSGS